MTGVFFNQISTSTKGRNRFCLTLCIICRRWDAIFDGTLCGQVWCINGRQPRAAIAHWHTLIFTSRWFSRQMCLKSSKGRYLNLYKSIKFVLHAWASSHYSFFSWLLSNLNGERSFKIVYQLKTVCKCKTSLHLISFIIAPSCWHVLYDISRVEKEDGTFISYSQMCLLKARTTLEIRHIIILFALAHVATKL